MMIKSGGRAGTIFKQFCRRLKENYNDDRLLMNSLLKIVNVDKNDEGCSMLFQKITEIVTLNNGVPIESVAKMMGRPPLRPHKFMLK
jgi:hypothetical protein